MEGLKAVAYGGDFHIKSYVLYLVIEDPNKWVLHL